MNAAQPQGRSSGDAYSRAAASIADPPRPRAHPVLGSAPDLRRSQVGTYARMMREHGDVVRLAVGPPGLRFELY